MKNEVIISFEGEYIKVISNGERSYESSFSLWSQIRDVCDEHQCFDVLGISNTTKPHGITEAFDFSKLFSELGITNKYRIAWVEQNKEVIETFYFIETVLLNRGFPGRLFSNIPEARKWLLKKNA